jgi:hypothetical protein
MHSILKLFNKAMSVFNGHVFERLTFQLGAFLLLFSSLVLPLGLHRVWVKVGGWWIFPALAALAFIGFAGHVTTHAAHWKLLALPYAGIYILDTLMLCELFYLSDRRKP